ncbi:Rpn family recombination-promoting nuclease/putative transposase [Sulfoacidibacillus ferrooxidans]|uniref:Transposase n=1 Tax=Sulfoacidibacillus ferrooxidans TaxID=2005001 RepID=A0A9X1VCQ0_9BACL|nr:Rpn family recombination-promoting nuclease/putative transposase [Sulfoacidibacillus ferrooxidans]MCI0184910.1 hypothetical protein [Sulfoacidibacillus ferrooxidans]
MPIYHNEPIDLMVDYAFKQLFGQARNKDLLMSFLNALLTNSLASPIISVQFGNTEQAQEYREDKLSRMDVFVETDQQERINIEMQVAHDYGMAKRTLYYWAELYRGQVVSGASYQELHRVITINLIDFVQFPSTDRYHTSYHVVEDQTHERLSDALEVHFVEMPKLRKTITDLEKAVQDPLEKWLLLLESGKNKTIHHVLEVAAMNDVELKKALDEVEEIGRNPENWALYISRKKAILDEVSREASYRERIEKAHEQGMEKARIELIQLMLSKKLSPEEITNLTDIPLEDIKKIAESIH